MKTNGSGHPYVLMVDETLIPLEPGSIAVDQISGQLKRADGHRSFNFGFTFAGLTFSVRARDDAGMILLECATVIGRMPYTIEDRQRRADLGYALNSLTGTGLAWHMSETQTIEIRLRLRLEAPATATRIVVALVETLLPIEEYLVILSDLARTSRPANLVTAFAAAPKHYAAARA